MQATGCGLLSRHWLRHAIAASTPAEELTNGAPDSSGLGSTGKLNSAGPRHTRKARDAKGCPSMAAERYVWATTQAQQLVHGVHTHLLTEELAARRAQPAWLACLCVTIAQGYWGATSRCQHLCICGMQAKMAGEQENLSTSHPDGKQITTTRISAASLAPQTVTVPPLLDLYLDPCWPSLGHALCCWCCCACLCRHRELKRPCPLMASA